MDGPRLFVGWIDGKVSPVGGWPLSGVIAEVVGLNPAHDELPGWLEFFAERAEARLRAHLLEDGAIVDAESLRGASFFHACWEPPPAEWVAVDRDETGRYGAMSMRAAPGPPSWGRDESPAWDHDHCEVCWQRLTNDPSYEDGEAAGWRTGCDWGSYRWVCDGCFRAFEDGLGWTRA